MDVSDGLVQDLGHLCRAAGCGAVIDSAAVPLSAAARAALGRDAALLPALLTGGDDYELLFAAPPGMRDAIVAAAAAAGTPVTRIGRFAEGAPEVAVIAADGTPMPLARGGWSHF
jgi:thiamine-monophosphate kinase